MKRNADTTSHFQRKSLPTAIGLLLGTLVATPVWALDPAPPTLPQGGQVITGSADIIKSQSTMTIDQQSQNVLIDWHDFSVGPAGEVIFNQQMGADSIAVNTVSGGQVSNIQGNISANGQVFIVNPNGIVFGPHSVINVQSLVATTAELDLGTVAADGKLKLTFDGAEKGQIINQGHLSAANGGLIALVAPSVQNSGVIKAQLGQVTIASADHLTVDFTGGQLITFKASPDLEAQINNTGIISGQHILISAEGAKKTLDNAINLDGVITATAAGEQDGVITLTGPDSGTINVGANLKAGNTAGDGGNISITGDNVVIGADATLDASGTKDGGHITLLAEDRLEISREAYPNISAQGGYQQESGTLTLGAETLYAVDEERYLKPTDPNDSHQDEHGSFDNSSKVTTEFLEAQLSSGTNLHFDGQNVVLFDTVDVTHVDGGVRGKADITFTPEGYVKIRGDLFVYGKLTIDSGSVATLGAYMFEREEQGRHTTPSYIVATDGIEVSAGRNHSYSHDQIRLNSNLYTDGSDITFHNSVLLQPNSDKNYKNLYKISKNFSDF